jgi:hypothetical protein
VKNNLKGQPRLMSHQVLAWADAHFRRHDLWPDRSSGQIVERPLRPGWASTAHCGMAAGDCQVNCRCPSS